MRRAIESYYYKGAGQGTENEAMYVPGSCYDQGVTFLQAHKNEHAESSTCTLLETPC